MCRKCVILHVFGTYFRVILHIFGTCGEFWGVGWGGRCDCFFGGILPWGSGGGMGFV